VSADAVGKSWPATSRLVPRQASTGHDHYFSRERSRHVGRGLITEEIGIDDGVTALQQLGLI